MGRRTTTSRRTAAAKRTRAQHTAAARQLAAERELVVARQVFETWWIEVPLGFDECWVAEGGYWHAWDEHRSVSVPSTVLRDGLGRPAPAAEIMDGLRDLIEGEPIEETPPGVRARATIIRTDPGSRASRALSGFVVVDGRVLVVTVTSDDVPRAVRTWQSIAYAPEGRR